jgi:16S rRNA (adenine1518-N6/adenine1519-N6)-dimethyltransferase
MFQKEVADRITAKPNTKAYGRLAIIVQYCCDVQRNFDLPAAAFTPPPKVDSTVVTLIPKKDIDKETFTLLGKVTHAAFNQRRKMLKSSLKPLFDNPEEALNAIGIDPTLRPENLEVAQFLKICCAVKPE